MHDIVLEVRVFDRLSLMILIRNYLGMIVRLALLTSGLIDEKSYH